MKITELKIAPKRSYALHGEDNPLVCTVKLSSDDATVETVLNDDDMHQMLRLVQRLVADAAARNIDAFVDEVTALEAGATPAQIGAS